MFTAKKQSVGVWGKVAVCIQRGSAVALVVLVPWHIVELKADAHLNQISFFFFRVGGVTPYHKTGICFHSTPTLKAPLHVPYWDTRSAVSVAVTCRA